MKVWPDSFKIFVRLPIVILCRHIGTEYRLALIDVVKYQGNPNFLVWKFPSDQLSLGSQLIVNESQEAIFFKGGQALDLFGAGTHTLSSGNLPILNKLVNLPFGGKTPFAAEVYFINKNLFGGQDWGTKNPIMLLDPKYRVTVPLRAYGQYGIRVSNSREFVTQVVGVKSQSSPEEIAKTILFGPILAAIQQSLGDFMVQKKITALELPANAIAIGDHTRSVLINSFKTFGLELVNFAVESINFDAKDESVARLRKLLDDAAHLEVMGDSFRRNEDFYRVEKQFEIMKGAAENSGAAGALAGAAMGVGIGFGMGKPAADLARDAMQPSAAKDPHCPKCNAVYKEGSKFCGVCGGGLGGEFKHCQNCKTENVPTAQFCVSCGQSLGAKQCIKCGTELGKDETFCRQCGTKA